MNKTNRLIKDLLSDNAENVIRAALSRIEETGDPALVKLVLDRLSPTPSHAPRDPYLLGELDSLKRCTDEMQRLASAVAAGEIEEDHAAEIAARIKDAASLLQSGELEQRLKALEARFGIDP